MAVVGLAGLLTARKEAYSLKTLYVFATFVCGILACLFMIQVRFRGQQSGCRTLLARPWSRERACAPVLGCACLSCTRGAHIGFGSRIGHA